MLFAANSNLSLESTSLANEANSSKPGERNPQMFMIIHDQIRDAKIVFWGNCKPGLICLKPGPKSKNGFNSKIKQLQARTGVSPGLKKLFEAQAPLCPDVQEHGK